MNTDNIALWETQHNNADWDCFKTPTLQEILRIHNQHQGDSYAFLEVEHFVPMSWMCKKQTSVSHSSTESEVISLDAGLRMDGVLARDLWDVVIAVLHSSKNTHTHAHIKHCETNVAEKSGAQIPKTS